METAAAGTVVTVVVVFSQSQFFCLIFEIFFKFINRFFFRNIIMHVISIMGDVSERREFEKGSDRLSGLDLRVFGLCARRGILVY